VRLCVHGIRHVESTLKVFEFENVLKLKSKGLKIGRTELKPPPKKLHLKFSMSKLRLKVLLFKKNCATLVRTR